MRLDSLSSEQAIEAVDQLRDHSDLLLNMLLEGAAKRELALREIGRFLTTLSDENLKIRNQSEIAKELAGWCESLVEAGNAEKEAIESVSGSIESLAEALTSVTIEQT